MDTGAITWPGIAFSPLLNTLCHTTDITACVLAKFLQNLPLSSQKSAISMCQSKEGRHKEMGLSSTESSKGNWITRVRLGAGSLIFKAVQGELSINRNGSPHEANQKARKCEFKHKQCQQRDNWVHFWPYLQTLLYAESLKAISR